MKSAHALAVVLSLLLGAAPARANLAFLPHLKFAAFVAEDVDGVPHILAHNEHDLMLLAGYRHAQDRLFQMDLLRRQASGTLAEVLGPDALPDDVQLRTLGLRRAAERSVDVISADAREALEAYAKGVNLFVERHALRPEYGLLEITRFEPWSALDSVAIGKLFAFGRSFDTLDLDLTVALLTYLDVGAVLGFNGFALFFEDLFRVAPFDPAATIPDATGMPPPVAPAPAISALRRAPEPHPLLQALPEGAQALRPETLELARRYLERTKGLPAFENALPGVRRGAQGSNEFAVSGEHAKRGNPLMANDPHLALDAPPLFYKLHLHAHRAGYDTAGSTFPGVPFVIQGQTDRIAWGSTTHFMDVVDFYQEVVVFDASSPSGLSIVHEGALEPIIPVPEVYRFNAVGDGVPDTLQDAPPGSVPPATLIVPRRNNGPILDLDVAAGTALSVQYTGFSPTREVDTFRDWNRARNLADFTRALETFDFGSQSWIYTDVAGNIAYFASAEMPLREDLQNNTVNGLPPFFVRNGFAGNEWLPQSTSHPGQAVPFEILPPDEMPQVVNPETGIIVNANNDPLGLSLDNDPLDTQRPAGGILYLNPGYDPGIRAGRIKRLLEERLARGPLGAGDMMEIQADVIMPDAAFFVPFIVDAFDRASAYDHPALHDLAADPRVVEAVDRLRDWDHSAPTGVVEGYDAIDVDGVRLTPTPEEIENSIAATIYSVWRGRLIHNTVDAALDRIEEMLEPFEPIIGEIDVPRPPDREAMKALRHLFDTFDMNFGVGASGLDFFAVPGVDDPEARRDIILLQSLRDALDLLAGDDFAPAFGHSPNQDDYRWGRLHRIVLEHPLNDAFDIPPAAGRFPPSFPDLPGLAVDGGWEVVDASQHDARAAGVEEFRFDAGPMRRYVGEARRHRIRGDTSLAGGQSGIPGDPGSVDLLGPWLTNEAQPLRMGFGEIFRDLRRLEIFIPKPKPRRGRFRR